jgi:hypothetical protein
LSAISEAKGGTMEKEEKTGNKFFGWFLITFSLFYLIAFPKIIASYHTLSAAIAGSPENLNFLPKLTAYSIVTTLFGFLLFFVTGIGILKVKRGAYYAALCIPFIYFFGIIKNIWLLGPQSIMKAPVFSILLISVVILLFLIRKDIIEQFKADYITRRGKRLNPKKFILWVSLIGVLVNVIAIAFWLLVVHVRLKDQLPVIDLKPKKVEYRVQDKSFILNDCEKREVFGYSVSIPQDLKIGMISMGSPGGEWNVGFLSMDNSDLKALIMLTSKGFGSLLLPINFALNFKTIYDFEKAIHYANWSPIYLVLKVIGAPKNLESIDEASASTWRGFVKVLRSKDKHTYDGSLYSLKNGSTCGIAVVSKDGVLTSGQVKSIIASLEFQAVKGSSESFFEKGKADLSGADFTSAALNFTNALYSNERNPEYAYYLARSLFEDSSAAGRKSRLGCSKRFLEYALTLNPSHAKAKELLISVGDEIKKAGVNKKE